MQIISKKTTISSFTNPRSVAVKERVDEHILENRVSDDFDWGRPGQNVGLKVD